MRRAFGLIELAVALTISMIVGVATLSVFSSVFRTRVRLERMTIADDNAKVLGHYLEREAQRVGGSRLRPWQSIGVENETGAETGPLCGTGDLPCVIGDRLTFAFPKPDFPPESCSIKAFKDNGDGRMKSGTISFSKDFDVGDGGEKRCCILMRRDREGKVQQIAPGDLVDTHLIVSNNRKHFAITFSGAERSASACAFRWVRSGQVEPLASASTSAADFDHEESGVDGAEQVTGFGVPIDVATFFVGCARGDCVKRPENRALFLFSDRNAGHTAAGTISVDLDGDDPDQLELITAGVIDFQVTRLADIDGDGDVDDSGDTASDEVFGNDAKDANVDFAGALRGIGFEIATGVMTHDPDFGRRTLHMTTLARPADEEAMPAGMHLRRIEVAAGFRNLNVMK